MQQEQQQWPLPTEPPKDSPPMAATSSPTPAPAPRISGAVPEELLCDTCAFWLWDKDETQTDGSVLRFGRCIIRAPAAVQPSYQRATWPKTEAKDGCGEHEDAPAPAPQAGRAA